MVTVGYAFSCLNPCFNGIVLNIWFPWPSSSIGTSLNPCFNGIVLNSDKEMDKYERKSLNPCFNGIVLNPCYADCVHG